MFVFKGLCDLFLLNDLRCVCPSKLLMLLLFLIQITVSVSCDFSFEVITLAVEVVIPFQTELFRRFIALHGACYASSVKINRELP